MRSQYWCHLTSVSHTIDTGQTMQTWVLVLVSKWIREYENEIYDKEYQWVKSTSRFVNKYHLSHPTSSNGLFSGHDSSHPEHKSKIGQIKCALKLFFSHLWLYWKSMLTSSDINVPKIRQHESHCASFKVKHSDCRGAWNTVQVPFIFACLLRSWPVRPVPALPPLR